MSLANPIVHGIAVHGLGADLEKIWVGRDVMNLEHLT
jgi:hypothetical protein